jgi:glutaconate CoA-transferase subunit A
MPELTTLGEAVAALVRDGDMVALEGGPDLVPCAAAQELVRRGRQGLTIVRVAPDLMLDQLVAAGCARRLIVGWGGSPGIARLHELHAALRPERQDALTIEQVRPTDLLAAYEAGAANLPFAVLRGYGGQMPMPRTTRIQPVRSPFDHREVAVIRPIRPDVAFLHAQEADRHGNVLLWGALGGQLAAAQASRRVVVTVEEISDDLTAWPNAVILPRTRLAAVCHVPGGAWPSAVQGHYERDRAFCFGWTGIARDPAKLAAWMRRHVLDTADFAAFRRTLMPPSRRLSG